MEFKIPRITKKIECKDYAPEFEGMEFEVWVNPPKVLLTEQAAIVEEMRGILKEVDAQIEKGEKKENPELGKRLESLNAALEAWFATVLTQKGEPLSGQDIHDLVTQCMDSDPRFWDWLRDKALGAILAHRETQKN